MAFSNTVRSKRINFNGQVEEVGVWALTGGSTTGDIVPSAATFSPSSTAFPTAIREINDIELSSDTNSSVLVSNLQPATFSPRSRLRLTSAANDTGTYTLIGRAA